MAKKNGEQPIYDATVPHETMEMDVVDEGRSIEPLNDARGQDAADEAPKLRENFPFSPTELPPRAEAKAFARKTPDASGCTTVMQISREDLDEKPRLGKTIVVCPYDKVFLEPAGSERGFTLFTCPVAGCDHTRKIVKPSLRQILMRDHEQEDHSARP